VTILFHTTDPRTVRLAVGKVQVVFFFAFWNTQSKNLAPLLTDLQTLYQARVNFIHIDADDPAAATLKKQLGYNALPQIFLLDSQGKIKKTWVGNVNSETLRAAIDALNP
jgi:thioredoxin-like negative regulator of GroEL